MSGSDASRGKIAIPRQQIFISGWQRDQIGKAPVKIPAGYTLHQGTPEIADYLQLRQICGLTPRSKAAAEAGLPNSVYSVLIRQAGQTVGMGRIVATEPYFSIL